MKCNKLNRMQEILRKNKGIKSITPNISKHNQRATSNAVYAS